MWALLSPDSTNIWPVGIGASLARVLHEEENSHDR